MAKENQQNSEKTDQAKKRKVRLYAMLALSVVIVAIGAGLVVREGIFYFNKTRFDKALQQNDGERAASLAVKIAHRHEHAADYLEASDLRSEYRRKFERTKEVVGTSLSPVWKGIDRGMEKGEHLYESRNYGEYIDRLGPLIPGFDKIFSSAQEIEFKSVPPVEGSVLRVSSPEGEQLFEAGYPEAGGIEVNILPAVYDFSFFPTNFSSWHTNIRIRATSAEEPVITAKLQPKLGTLIIDSEPVAGIWREGEKIGSSGEEIDLPLGVNTLTLRAKARKTTKVTVDIMDETRERLEISLKRKCGDVRISARLASDFSGDPPNRIKGRIAIAGSEPRMVELPHIWHDIPLGKHRVELEVPGYESMGPETVEIDYKREASLTFTLVPKPVTIRFDFGGIGNVKVYRDGDLLVQGDEEVSLLPFKEHRLQFRAPGYENLHKTITLEPRSEEDAVSVPIEMEKLKPYRLEVGTRRSAVLRWQGKPDAIRNYSQSYIYVYGDSTITFSRKKDRVLEWEDAGNLKGLPEGM